MFLNMCSTYTEHMYICVLHIFHFSKKCLMKMPSCNFHIFSLYAISKVHPTPPKKKKWILSFLLMVF